MMNVKNLDMEGGFFKMVVKRNDGRKADELRPISAKVGVVPNADGSAIFKLGKTVAIAAVYGPRLLHPQHMQKPDTGILRVNYDLLSFSVDERKRPGPNRRSTEISKVTEMALLPAVDIKEFKGTVIDVQIYILQANAGTRTAGINAASMALAHAGIPMKGLVTSVAVGKIDKDLILDVDDVEEHFEDGEGATDFPMAKLYGTDKYTLMQMDGKIQPDLVPKALDMADKAFEKIYEVQKKALKNVTGEKA
jgi:exosome complex component RRP41